jgi:hypothetical protein
MNLSDLGADITLMAGGLAGLAITTVAILRDLGAMWSRVMPTDTVPAEPVSSTT